MGSPASEQDRWDWEGPQTQVTITHGFWMGRYEVTQGEYQAVMGSKPSHFGDDPNRPVEQVSWHQATNYCGKLTAGERVAGRLPAGYVYRLPTEAEWEYARRAGTTTRFSYGDDLGYAQLGNYAWYGSNSDGTTHAVGLKQPNAWGLYDMHGNVWEWCLDWYGAYPGGSVTDPQGPASGEHRVFRGGGWYGGGRYCRSAYRYDRTPDARDSYVGFRAVLAPGQP
jgi:formylglycine-generating enzyme required for sulfatase activity